MWHEDDVNFPSAGTRFMTWRAADSRRLGVWDGARGEARGIVAYESPSQRVLRPHIAGSLITWLFVDDSVEPELSEIRYALVP
jgi:hypothetical protein